MDDDHADYLVFKILGAARRSHIDPLELWHMLRVFSGYNIRTVEGLPLKETAQEPEYYSDTMHYKALGHSKYVRNLLKNLMRTEENNPLWTNRMTLTILRDHKINKVEGLSFKEIATYILQSSDYDKHYSKFFYDIYSAYSYGPFQKGELEIDGIRLDYFGQHISKQVRIPINDFNNEPRIIEPRIINDKLELFRRLKNISGHDKFLPKLEHCDKTDEFVYANFEGTIPRICCEKSKESPKSCDQSVIMSFINSLFDKLEMFLENGIAYPDLSDVIFGFDKHDARFYFRHPDHGYALDENGNIFLKLNLDSRILLRLKHELKNELQGKGTDELNKLEKKLNKFKETYDPEQLIAEGLEEKLEEEFNKFKDLEKLPELEEKFAGFERLEELNKKYQQLKKLERRFEKLGFVAGPFAPPEMITDEFREDQYKTINGEKAMVYSLAKMILYLLVLCDIENPEELSIPSCGLLSEWFDRCLQVDPDNRPSLAESRHLFLEATGLYWLFCNNSALQLASLEHNIGISDILSRAARCIEIEKEHTDKSKDLSEETKEELEGLREDIQKYTDTICGQKYVAKSCKQMAQIATIISKGESNLTYEKANYFLKLLWLIQLYLVKIESFVVKSDYDTGALEDREHVFGDLENILNDGTNHNVETLNESSSNLLKLLVGGLKEAAAQVSQIPKITVSDRADVINTTKILWSKQMRALSTVNFIKRIGETYLTLGNLREALVNNIKLLLPEKTAEK